MFLKFFKYFSSPQSLVFLNLFLLFLGIAGNTIWQVFCVPTAWAIIALIVCFITTALFPITSRIQLLLPLLSFINGVSFFIFIYCILFLEQMNFLGFVGILYFGLGLLTFIPHFFAIQLMWKNVIFPKKKGTRLFFIIGVVGSMAVSVFVGFKYDEAMKEIYEFEESNYQVLDKNFMTEKILGMHFIYHTRFCEYDGWRPPKHEPLLVIGMWLNNRKDPLLVSLEKRVELYRKFFPEKRVKFDCSCARQYEELYFNDSLWKE